MHATYGSYSTPQGRMLANFLLWRDGDDYCMQLPHELAEPIRNRLSMHILRARVKAIDVSAEYGLLGLAGTDAEATLKPWFPDLPAAPMTMAKDTRAVLVRLGADRFQVIAEPTLARELMAGLAATGGAADSDYWNWLEIRAGIPWITPATQDQFVPQMANLDLIGGVSFNKGCYPGQEIVARMHFLGRLKQRMYLAHIAAEQAPPAGEKLYSAEFGEQACGTIVNAAPSPDGGFDLLAVVQISCADSQAVHAGTPDGPVLKFLNLPYKP